MRHNAYTITSRRIIVTLILFLCLLSALVYGSGVTGAQSANHPPVAVMENLPVGYEDSHVVFKLDGFDPDGDPVTARLVFSAIGTFYQVNADGSRGSLIPKTINLPGSPLVTHPERLVWYQPPANFQGSESFVYQLFDSSGLESNVLENLTVRTLPVNDPPMAFGIAHDGLSTDQFFAVRLSYFDIDNVLLTGVITRFPTDGKLYRESALVNEITPANPAFHDPTIYYAPNEAPDFETNTDSLSFFVSDGELKSETVTDTINVIAADRPPTRGTTPTDITTPMNTDVGIRISPFDLETDPAALHIRGILFPTHGRIFFVNLAGTERFISIPGEPIPYPTPSPEPTIFYRPDPGYQYDGATPDRFSYTVRDGQGDITSFTINIYVIGQGGSQCPVITIIPTALPDAALNAPYPQTTFEATGGNGPYTFALSGARPNGIGLSGPTLAGTPAEFGNFQLTVTATDANGCTGSQSLTLKVEPPLPPPDEVCDGVDNDGDGLIDDGVKPTFYKDGDADGLGDPNDSIVACTAPTGYVGNKIDNCPHVFNPGQKDTDGDGIGDACEAPPNRPPTANAGQDQVVEATGPAGAEVTLNAVTSDPDGDTLIHQWMDGATSLGAGPSITPVLSLGTHTIALKVEDGKGGEVTDSVIVQVIDTRPPVLSALPANMIVEATSPTGATVNYVTPTATDLVDGSVTPVCMPPSGSTLAVGITTVVCTATDAHNNSAQSTFKVTVGYCWSGVLQPINADGSSIFKRGSTVPVKFALVGASAGIQNLVASLYAAKVSNTVTGLEQEAGSTAVASTGNQFRYDAEAGQYIFNWSTKGLDTGTYQLRIDLGDGVSRTVLVSLR